MLENSTSLNANSLDQQKQEEVGPRLTKRIFRNKKADAKRRSVPFDLIYENIQWPTHCPLLGIPLDYSIGTKRTVQPNSPSFDRIDPAKGYLTGNVRIVSHKANLMKNNGSVDELIRLACSLKELQEYE